MFRRILKNMGRLACLFVVGLLTFGYLASGLKDERPPAKVDPKVSIVSASSKSSPAIVSVKLENAEGSQDCVEQLDNAFERRWADDSSDVAPPADWTTVCRRLSLAMAGSGMSLEEIRELELLDTDQRVKSHLEKLLRNPRFHDYWGERFTRVFVGTEDGPFITFRRRRFRHWLSDAIAQNRPYDQLVRNLVTAQGLWTDRPEVNFLTVTVGTNEEGQPDPIRLAGRTARAFLGMRIDCLQCHDDFLGNVSLGSSDNLRGGQQTDFHSLAAFYSTARLNGLQGIRQESHPYEYRFLNDDETSTVEPKVPFAPELMPTEGQPRERLAAWLVHPENKQSARAIVNRVWALMFGRPLTDGVDNIPLDAIVHPALDLLASDFVDHGYDLRRLIRIIVASRPFKLASAADFEVTERHEKQWSVFPLTRLRPEQVAGSVIQSARVKTVDRESSLLIQLMKYGSSNDFVSQYGDSGQDEFIQGNVTITQRLVMLNGELVDGHSGNNTVFNAGAHIMMFAKNDEAAIEAAYLCVLNRYPDDEERSAFATKLGEAKNREAVMTDIYWVLLNSSEMTWNH